MTDKEVLTEMFAKIGFKIEREEFTTGIGYYVYNRRGGLGYTGFVTEYVFDEDGSLIDMGAWE